MTRRSLEEVALIVMTSVLLTLSMVYFMRGVKAPELGECVVEAHDNEAASRQYLRDLFGGVLPPVRQRFDYTGLSQSVDPRLTELKAYISKRALADVSATNSSKQSAITSLLVITVAALSATVTLMGTKLRSSNIVMMSVAVLVVTFIIGTLSLYQYGEGLSQYVNYWTNMRAGCLDRAYKELAKANGIGVSERLFYCGLVTFAMGSILLIISITSGSPAAQQEKMDQGLG